MSQMNHWVSMFPKALQQHRGIFVLRAESAADALWMATQVLAAGGRLLEVTFTVPDAVSVMTALQPLLADYPDAVMGAGTVLTQAQANEAIGAGARFLVSPTFDAAIMQAAHQQDIPYIPGVLTPAEIYQAMAVGAPVLKVFPIAAMGGASYLSMIKGPFPELQCVATGGVEAADAAAYLKAGALAVGYSTPLFPKHLITARDAEGLVAHLHPFVGALGLAAV